MGVLALDSPQQWLSIDAHLLSPTLVAGQQTQVKGLALQFAKL